MNKIEKILSTPKVGDKIYYHTENKEGLGKVIEVFPNKHGNDCIIIKLDTTEEILKLNRQNLKGNSLVFTVYKGHEHINEEVNKLRECKEYLCIITEEGINPCSLLETFSWDVWEILKTD